MRVLALGINYSPDQTGIAPFTTGRCEYLAARGHQVRVCTGFPYYPAWRVRDADRGRLFAREAVNGVTVLRSYAYVPRRVTAARRILHEASFVASASLRALIGPRPDVLFVVSPPLGLALPAVLLSRLWGIPYVFHVADLQPDSALDLGMLPPGLLARALYLVERLAYRRAALVTTLTDAMRRRIVAKGIAEAKVVLASDWADPALFSIPLRGGGEAFRRAFGLEDRFLVVHAGNMGVKQGLDVVLEAAAGSRRDPDVVYVLVGDGAMRASLEGRATALGLSNVRFVPLQPRTMFLDLLAAADVCLVTQQRTVADIVFPSKVLTLLAAGRPVVASVSPGSEVARVVREADAGLVVPPEDPGSLREAVATLRGDAAARDASGERGRAYARRHWDRERVLSEMEARLLRLTGSPARVSTLSPEPDHVR